ncbi:MAG: hemolysin family protein [Pyrinomonadaceae bacterium]
MDDPASLLLLFAAETASPESSPSFAAYTALNIFLVMILVAANGFFVAAEFAFVAVRKSRIETQANEGSKSAVRLYAILNNLNAYLSASQLGITLASLGLGWVGEPAIASLLDRMLGGSLPEASLHIVSFIIAFTIITSLHIVLGEQAPKLVGLQLAEKVAMATALPMMIFYKVFKPFIHVLDWLSAKVVNLVGIEVTSEHASIYTEDEIRQLIRISEESGHVNKEERALINKIFDFSETTVKEAMIPRTEITAISETCTLDEISRTFGESGYSRLPVYRGSLDDIAGVIHSKDLVGFINRRRAFRLESILIKPNYVVDTARLEDVLRQMQKEKFHFGFVVDEHGGVEGIITLEDLLEEIVGDISDEHDEEVNEQIAEQPDGSYVLDGGLAVRDLNRRLNTNIPISDGYTTVAGFLMAESGQILAEGNTVPFNGHVFRVLKVHQRRIKQIKMERTPTRTSEMNSSNTNI